MTTSTTPPASPSPCSHSRGFSISLTRDTGGEASPIAAAEWFAVHGAVWSDIPTTGWRVIRIVGPAADVQSGSMTLQAARGPDGTWQVLSGSAPLC